MKTKFKGSKGITLIALVITIIVLLILAGVSIAMLTGQNGILTQAQRAKTETENAAANEAAILDEYNKYLNNITNGGTTGGGGTTGSTLGTVTGNETSNTTVQDSLENKVVVPAGFKVVNPTDNVEDGIIIEDVSAKDSTTAGSQFVWIPVGTIHRDGKEDVTINLDRYTFASNGDETAQGNNEIDEYNGEPCQELTTSSYGNTTAKENIESETEGFRGSAITNGGFYIGRYEARDGVTTGTARTSSSSDTNQVVTKAGSFVYNYVTQPQAATLSRNMYSSSNFTSDLINSYAWDTAIVFIQKCSGDTDYSQQNSLNTGSLATTGTTNDNPCNIYDMASNCVEWSTETAKNNSIPCVNRGGYCYYSGYLAGTRYGTDAGDGGAGYAFRPLLYL